MPSAAEILVRLAAIANERVAFAAAWHIVILAFCIALLGHAVRPTVRVATLALATPLVSVSAFAFTGGLAFNGAVFGVLAIVLGALAVRLPRERVRFASQPTVVLGAGSVVYGLIYPHFLEGAAPIDYLLGAPTGLIPCPTLAVVIGLTMIGGGFGAPVWSRTLASLGLFYGVLGVAWLRVGLDVGLIVASVSLFVVSASSPQPRSSGSSRGTGTWSSARRAS